MCLRTHYYSSLDSEWVLYEWLGELGLQFRFLNTCGHQHTGGEGFQLDGLAAQLEASQLIWGECHHAAFLER